MVEFKREDFISNIYEVSKSKEKNQALMDAKEGQIEIYDFDQVKKWFCNTYRNAKELRSCDAYYQDENRNYLVIEFKNTPHKRMKAFMQEIEEKMLDTHMLLAETFWKNRKPADIAKKVSLLVVYHDTLNYGKGVTSFAGALNCVQPKNGNKARKPYDAPYYNNEEEYLQAKEAVTEKYRKTFYKEIEWLEKKEFYERYIESDYFALETRR